MADSFDEHMAIVRYCDEEDFDPLSLNQMLKRLAWDPSDNIYYFVNYVIIIKFWEKMVIFVGGNLTKAYMNFAHGYKML